MEEKILNQIEQSNKTTNEVTNESNNTEKELWEVLSQNYLEDVITKILSLRDKYWYVDLADIENHISITPEHISKLLWLNSTRDETICKFVWTWYAWSTWINSGYYDTATMMYLTSEEISNRRCIHMWWMYYFASSSDENYKLWYRSTHTKSYDGSLLIKFPDK